MRILYLIILLVGFSFNQERSVIFNTGSPDSLTTADDIGYTISSSTSIANRFSVNNSYVLEAMVFYMKSLNITGGTITVSIKEDTNGEPGELVSDLSQWEYNLSPLNSTGYNLIVTTDLCIYLQEGENYWWEIKAADENTEAVWLQSNGNLYTYAESSDNGNHWQINTGYAGAGGIWAEQIFETSINDGDVNSDFVINVVDVVSVVNYILGNSSFSADQIVLADIDNNSTVDVVDLVALVNMILQETETNPDFELLDINPESEFYMQNIGPSFFMGNNQVSGYYFGKAG